MARRVPNERPGWLKKRGLANFHRLGQIARVLAMVFDGCACRGAFHAGVLQEFAERGLQPALAGGASSGALAAVAVASGRMTALADLWEMFAGQSVVSWREVIKNRSPFKMSSLLKDGVQLLIGAGDLRQGPGEAVVTALTLPHLSLQYFSSRQLPSMANVVLGSCFIPGIYGHWITNNGRWLLDGGLVDNFPLEAVDRPGVTQIVAVTTKTTGRPMKHPLKKGWVPLRAPGHNVGLAVVRPRRPLAIGSWDLDRIRVRAAIDEGRWAAADWFDGAAEWPAG